MEETQPWILNFFQLPQSLSDDEVSSSLQVLCYLLFSDEDTAARIFDVIDLLMEGTFETLYMVFLSSFFTILFGLPLGVILTTVSYTHLTLPTMASVCRSRWSPYH